MARRFHLSNHYNIVGFCNEFQEFIRIVRYVPENRLVCIITLIGGGFWNHPDDTRYPDRFIALPPSPDGSLPFEEVSFEEIAAAGWDKYLHVFRSDYDFNDTSLHAAWEDEEKLTLTMHGGFIGGRRLYTDSMQPTGRFSLHIYKPYTVHAGPFGEEDLTGRFPAWFTECTAGEAEPVLRTDWYSDGVDFIRFCMRVPHGKHIQLHFRSHRIDMETDRHTI